MSFDWGDLSFIREERNAMLLRHPNAHVKITNLTGDGPLSPRALRTPAWRRWVRALARSRRNVVRRRQHGRPRGR